MKKGTVEKISVHGAALQGNLEGDSPDRTVYVYLPPSYASNRTQHYPVVNFLHGYGFTAERWMSFTNLAEAADKNIAAGTMREMIFSDFGITHTFETYDGDHTNRVVERIEQKVLPFFSKNLKR
jgi:enterochelin esterase-like enzyme